MNDREMKECRAPERQIERAIAIMHRLRAPGGCPWDAEQTHDSLISNMIEECYECIDAIREKDWAHMREELGDVLLQVLFHAELAQENPQAGFGISDVAQELCEKLVRRHPHVFGESAVQDTEGVLSQWEQIKRTERRTEAKPYLHDCGKGLPELLRASKLTRKVAKVGFDWPNHAGVVEKIREETREVEETLALPDEDERVAEELGDLLFTVVNLCRRRGVNPEMALHTANEKFIRRFHAVETALAAEGISLKDAPVDKMEEAWQKAKTQEHTQHA